MAETTPIHLACYTSLCALVVTMLVKLKLGRRNLSPSPWTPLVIGNMRSQLSDQPHQAMHRLTQWYSPVMLLRIGHVPTLVLSSAEAAKEVMKAPGEAVFASQPGGENFSLAELLSPGHIRSFRPFREEEAACLAASISFTMSYCGPVLVDVGDRAKAMMKDIFMKVVFGDYPRWKSVFFVRSSVGDRCPQLEAYLEKLHEVLDVMSGLDPRDLFPTEEALRGGSQRATQEVHERFRSIMDAMIRYHTTAMESEEADAGPGRREDILTTLLLLRRDGGMTLTDENIGSVLFGNCSKVCTSEDKMCWKDRYWSLDQFRSYVVARRNNKNRWRNR